MEIFAFLKIMNNQIQRCGQVLAAGLFGAGLFGAGLFGAALIAPGARAEAQAQSGNDRVSVSLSDPSRPAFIKASSVNGSITVKAYEGKEVIVEARERNEENEKPTGGPKRLKISTTGLTVEEENNEIRISTESYARTIDLTISTPVHTSVKLRAVNDGDITVTGVDGEIDVDDVNGAVTLNNISGSAVAHALNEHVHVTFTKVNPQKPMAFSSLNGDIDVTFPADLKANVSIRSDRGDVFSDFDVQLNAAAPRQEVEDGRGKGGKYRVKIDKTVHGTINGGGPEYQFTNFQGRIYIRKAGSPR
jgi:DUF4097 and DUF4098 domain-containing protein YvlB